MFRFSASTTRDMNIGDLRIALLNYICAKQINSQFIVRVCDTDKKSMIEGKDDEMLDILTIFGLKYDYLYYQSENFKYHLQFASALMDKGKAFACFCTPQELSADMYSGKCINISQEELLTNNLPFVIRIKKPTQPLHVKDTLQGNLSFDPDVVDSFVIMSKEKYPTNNFACACDDMLQGVSDVIDEDKHLLDAPKQKLIRTSLGYEEEIRYAYVPTMISLEDETQNVKWLLDQGFMPEAILNYVVLLGNTTPTEIFTIEEAISWFDIRSISKSPVHFDIEKLRFINCEHIKQVSDMELSKRMGYACENIGKLAKLYTQEVSTTYEIKQKIDVLFAPKPLHVQYEKEFRLLKELIQQAPYLDTFEAFEAYLLKKSELQGEAFLTPLRFLLTGCDNGLQLALLYPLIKNYLKEIVR